MTHNNFFIHINKVKPLSSRSPISWYVSFSYQIKLYKCCRHIMCHLLSDIFNVGDRDG